MSADEFIAPPLKVVFLDIDGVLNTQRNCLAQDGRARPFDSSAVTALNRVLRATGAKIVVSSTWRIKPVTWSEERRLQWLDELLMLEGMPAGIVVGYTPVLYSELTPGNMVARPRREEIQAWLDLHPEVAGWVAIDDDPDAGPENLVLCDEGDGLTDDLAARAIAYLMR